MTRRKTEVLICGSFDYGPIGRHAYTWLYALLNHAEINLTLCPTNLVPKKKILSSDLLRGKKNKIESEAIEVINHTDGEPSKSFDYAVFAYYISIYLYIYISICSVEMTPGFDYFVCVKSKIKAGYIVHDGSFPPQEWVEVLNENFDVCFSPSAYVSDAFLKAGLIIPCSSVPCGIFSDATDNKKISKAHSNNKSNASVTVSLICGMDSRKKPLEVLQSFVDEFSPDDYIELVVHSQYSSELITQRDSRNYIKKQLAMGIR